MKRIFLLSFFFSFVSFAHAAPESVIIYPDGAIIHEKQLFLVCGGNSVCINVPQGVDVSNLLLEIEGSKVLGTTVRTVQATESPQFIQARTALETVGKALNKRKDTLEAVLAERKLWLAPPLELRSAAELRTALEYSKIRLVELAAEESQIIDEMFTLEKQRVLLKTQLIEMGEAPELAQEVKIFLDSIPQAPVIVAFSYQTPAAGWRPVYRVEALTGEKSVALSMDAEIWQTTGHTWENVQVSLATINPAHSSDPTPLSPWIVRPGMPEAKPMLSMAPRANKVNAGLEQDTMFSAAAAPSYSEGAAFATWNLGQRNLAPGPRVVLPLMVEKIDANFDYTLRPARSAEAHLSATLAKPVGKHFPMGQAVLVVDGVHTGNTMLNLVEDKKQRLYFGVDPLVRGTMTQTNQKSGSKGLINKDQTYIWDWDIEVFNKHKQSVQVRLEDAQPQSRDERIVLNIQSSPTAEVEGNALVWKLEIPGQSSSKIKHAVRMTAPADMPVSEGR